MKSPVLGFTATVILFCGVVNTAYSQNVEGGFHAGLAVLGDETPLGTETGGEYGVWFLIWPTSNLALAADWSYAPREDFVETIGASPVGERDRNRQYVDLTLQYHVPLDTGFTVFVEAGGGSHWNNRHVENPSGVPEWEEEGKESDLHGVWTLGGGFRKQLLPHLNWIGEFKIHNLGSTQDGVRFITGITLSLR